MFSNNRCNYNNNRQGPLRKEHTNIAPTFSFMTMYRSAMLAPTVVMLVSVYMTLSAQIRSRVSTSPAAHPLPTPVGTALAYYYYPPPAQS